MLSSLPSFKMSQKSFPLLFALSVHVDAFTSLACSTVFLCVLNKSSRMDVSPIRSVIWEELLVWVELGATQPFVEMLDDHIGCSLSLKGCEEVVMLVLLSFTGAQLLWGTCPEVDDDNFSVEGHLNVIVCEVCTAMQVKLRGFGFTHFLFLWCFSAILNLRGWYLNLRFKRGVWVGSFWGRSLSGFRRRWWWGGRLWLNGFRKGLSDDVLKFRALLVVEAP